MYSNINNTTTLTGETERKKKKKKTKPLKNKSKTLLHDRIKSFRKEINLNLVLRLCFNKM